MTRVLLIKAPTSGFRGNETVAAAVDGVREQPKVTSAGLFDFGKVRTRR